MRANSGEVGPLGKTTLEWGGNSPPEVSVYPAHMPQTQQVRVENTDFGALLVRLNELFQKGSLTDQEYYEAVHDSLNELDHHKECSNQELRQALAEYDQLRISGQISAEEFVMLATEAADSHLSSNNENVVEKLGHQDESRQPSSSRIREEKTCPFCGEQILAVAVKCKHCRSNLGGSSNVRTEEDWFAERVARNDECKTWQDRSDNDRKPNPAGQSIGILGCLIVIGCFFAPWMSCGFGGEASGYDLSNLSGILWLIPISMFAALCVLGATKELGGPKRAKPIVGILTCVAGIVLIILFSRVIGTISKLSDVAEAAEALLESSRWGLWGTIVGIATIDVSLKFLDKKPSRWGGS